MKVGIPKEIAEGERRVALVPETVKRLAGKDIEVAVEAGAGEGAHIPDSEYEAAGATIVADAADVFGGVDAVVKVNAPTLDDSAGRCEFDLLKKDSVLVALLYPRTEADLVRRLAEAGVTSFSLDLMPRITRAQSMDVLSSMSTVAGYRAVLIAAGALPEMMPMLMTAAGTIRPAKALIIGAGVAGLQAIATARRLGAVVKAVDVRPAVQEQIESLGARFVSMEVKAEETETAGGYAKDLGEEVYKKQREILAPHVEESNLIITTALVPGREAPQLISEEMVQSMKPGSVIVDLAAPAGGNCALTKPGGRVVEHGVTILGPLNLPSEMAVDASQMFSRNVAAYLGELVKDGELTIDMENEVISGTLVTRDGEIVNEAVRKAIGEGEGEEEP